MTNEELLVIINDLQKRVQLLESDAAMMPESSNPGRYFRVESGGKSKDGLGPFETCPACKGKSFLPYTEELTPIYDSDGEDVRKCPLCHGTGSFRKMLSRFELNLLRDSK